MAPGKFLGASFKQHCEWGCSGVESAYEAPIKMCKPQEALEILYCVGSHFGIIHFYALLTNSIPQEGGGVNMKKAFLPFDVELVLPEPSQHSLNMCMCLSSEGEYTRISAMYAVVNFPSMSLSTS